MTHFSEHKHFIFSALPITQSLNLLKKLLIDDAQNIHQLLPDFYLSGCHRTFFLLADNCFRSNFTKGSFITTWHNIIYLHFKKNTSWPFTRGLALHKSSFPQICWTSTQNKPKMRLKHELWYKTSSLAIIWLLHKRLLTLNSIFHYIWN